MLTYEVIIEDIDNYGNVTGSECEFTTEDKNKAIEKAKELRYKYSNVVVEIHDRDDFMDVYLDTIYLNKLFDY